MTITRLDHLVLTVASIERTCAFYEKVLGMTRETFAGGRTALKFGQQKINLHEAGKEFEPKAVHPTPGSGDLCFVVEDVHAAQKRLEDADIEIIEGPVARTGAVGELLSLYCRDPDGNLIELSQYQ
jgi:catechol 2,3-dioxygenase-like lactoylglutathione lyase family enzyme